MQRTAVEITADPTAEAEWKRLKVTLEVTHPVFAWVVELAAPWPTA